MGLPVLILGESGTGKSASLRNFSNDELIVVNVANKPLPFKNKIKSIATDTYKEIIKELKTTDKKVVVIDDAQYLMANEFMRRATERGFDKFTEIAQNFWVLVNTVKDLPDDTIVYFMAHIERDQNGNEKIKTIGKLLDEKITVEGMFTIVLKTNVTDGVYSFLTQNSGHDTVKSPIGMFKSFAIDNDLKFVDDKIRNYYEMGSFKSDEEMEEAEETVKHEVEKEEKPKRGRKKQQLEEERAEVKARNEAKIAEANTTENGEGLPFEEAKEPKLEPMPKRKSRTNKVQADLEPETTDESNDAVEKPKRTRTRRTSSNEPVEATDVPGIKETSEAPARRRRRKAD